MKKIILQIDGMTCSACSSGLEKYLKKQKGIIDANVNLILSTATIQYENIKVKEIEKMIQNAGFVSMGEFKSIDEQETNSTEVKKLIIMGILLIIIVFLLLSQSLFLINNQTKKIIIGIIFLLTIVFLIDSKKMLISGIKNMIHRTANMDSLVFFSVIASFLYSTYGMIRIYQDVIVESHLYFESTCMVLYFIKLGRFIESKSKDKTKEAIKKLVQITPKQAYIKKEKEIISVSIDEIKKEDVVICKAGEKIAVDGIVVVGSAYVDESFITGESIPVEKKKGDKVIAGSISYNGYLEYRAEKIGKESTISEIVKLVVEATTNKTKIQKLADKISGYFVPVICFIAIITLIIQLATGTSFQESFHHCVTVLVVACPCALGLAVPMVVVVSNGWCAQKGLFIRNTEVLENAKDIDTIVLDKTGTLTYGKLKIYKVINYSQKSEEEILNVVANIESKSTHPIATAFQIQKKLSVDNYKTYDGIGIYGEINKKKYYLGNRKIATIAQSNVMDCQNDEELLSKECTIIYVIENKKVIALIGIKDIIRPNIEKFIKIAQKQKKELIILTGDNEQVAHTIAKEVGINKVIANVVPKEKSKMIKQLIKEGKKVAMVGDGINDAPALVNATVGVSVNDGTDIAMDAADVILMNNNLNNILDLIKISKNSYQIIKQNLFWAFFYNIAMIPIAIGLLEPIGIKMNPALGSIAMVVSSLSVTLNSLRLRKDK